MLFGIFSFIVFARRQPRGILYIKICSKFRAFRVVEFSSGEFLVVQEKSGGDPSRITEHFDTAEAEIIT